MLDKLGLKPENYFRIFLDDMTIGKHVSIAEPLNIYNDTAIMLMAGYLTVDSIDDTGESTQYRLRIPNNEIKMGIINSILSRRTSPENIADPLGLANPKYKGYYDTFYNRIEHECERLFLSFVAFASHKYHLTDELFMTFLLSMCLDISKHKSAIEVHTTKGRTDVALFTPAGEWMIIEVKSKQPTQPSYPANPVIPDNPVNPAFDYSP